MHTDRQAFPARPFATLAAALIALAGPAWTLADPPAGLPPSAPSTSPPDTVQENDVPEWIRRAAPNPHDPGVKLYAQQQKQRVEAEKALKKLRATHFKSVRNPKIRADGIAELQEYNKPALYPSLIEIFQHEQDDVRSAVLDMLSKSATDEGDASLAWVAVESDDPAFREMAKARLLDRVSTGNGASNRVRLVIMQALRSKDDTRIASAAHLAQNLGLFETIPWLIQAQLGGTSTGGGGGGGNGQGALAWILVGQQQAFVSDLTPVVGESAVGFDPTLSTITTGTILRVIDANVITYRTEVNTALIDLSSKLSGHDTSGLGWNQPGWWKWYVDEGKAMIAAKQAEQAAQPAVGASQPAGTK